MSFFRGTLFVSTLLFWASWGLGAEWYVDAAASGKKTGASWIDAWTDLDQISGVAPGDTVFMSGGPAGSSKIYHTNLWKPMGGSDIDHPITYKVSPESGHNGVVLFDGTTAPGNGVAVSPASFVTLDGGVNNEIHLRFQNVRNLAIYSEKRAGIRLRYIDFDNRTVRLTGCNRIEVAYCKFRPQPGSGDTLALADVSGDGWDVNLIHGNLIELASRLNGDGLGDDGIKWGSSISIYNNTFRGYFNANPGIEHQDAIQSGGRWVKVYNNTFENINQTCFFGVRPSDVAVDEVRDIWIFNNVFKLTNPGIGGVVRVLEIAPRANTAIIDNVRINNNTIVDYPVGIGVGSSNSQIKVTITNTEVSNNLIYNTGWGGFSALVFPNFPAEQIKIANNLIDPGTKGDSGAGFPNAKTWQNAPGFVSYREMSDSNDLRLRSDEGVARDGGVDTGSYFAFDRNGVIRPFGPAFDIGAYEYCAGDCPAEEPIPKSPPLPTKPSIPVSVPTPDPDDSTENSSDKNIGDIQMSDPVLARGASGVITLYGAKLEEVSVYSRLGTKIVELELHVLNGLPTASWNGTDGSGGRVASGTYVFVIRTADGMTRRKVVVAQ